MQLRKHGSKFSETEEHTWCYKGPAIMVPQEFTVFDTIYGQLCIPPTPERKNPTAELSAQRYVAIFLQMTYDIFYPFDKCGLLSWQPMLEAERLAWMHGSIACVNGAFLTGWSLHHFLSENRTNDISAIYPMFKAGMYKQITPLIKSSSRNRFIAAQLTVLTLNMTCVAVSIIICPTTTS